MFKSNNGERNMVWAIYMRVSTASQWTRSQEPDLQAWAAQAAERGETVMWYTDTACGKNYDRPGWQRLKADIDAGKVNGIVVWSLDRLGRNAGETIMLFDRLDKLGVSFLSLREGPYPPTSAGRLLRNILASMAQFDCEVMEERRDAGIAAAKAQGKRWGGRKHGTRITLTEEKEAACRKLKEAGNTVASIARDLGISRNTVYVALERGEPATTVSDAAP